MRHQINDILVRHQAEGSFVMKTIALALAGLLAFFTTCWAQQPTPLEAYRNMEFPPGDGNFEKGWQERVALEQKVINDADLAALRAALKDRDPFVRAIAARALGIRADKPSADALADLVKTDPEYMVRIRAVESLGYLKMRPEAIEEATKDATWGPVVGEAGRETSQGDADYAEPVRKAYAEPIPRKAMGSAGSGQPAPDFTALTLDGNPFRLSAAVGKGPSPSTSPPSRVEGVECTSRRSCA
jgi:hypothetical protein